MKSKIITVNRSFVVKGILICLFVIYTLMVIDFTLINDNFGRNPSNVFLAEREQVSKYFTEKINIIPFATVKLFISAYKSGRLETYVVAENILGNFFVFMPFAFFVANIFKKINSAMKFLAFISIGVLLIEILQVIFLTGSADIDDFILNVGGAMAAYGALNVSNAKRGINKFLFGENDET